MVARLLEQAGFYVGEQNDLLEPQQDNPLGFWERSDVVQLNDRILSDADSHWFGSIKSVCDPKSYQVDVAAIVSRLSPPWLIKDPRMLLTWPVWSDSLADALPVFVYRDPISVARSLQRRNSFPLRYGLALWEYYNRTIIGHLVGRECVVVPFDDFAKSPELETTRLLAALDLSLDVEQPFESAMNHTKVGEVPDELLSTSQRHLREHLERLPRGRTVGITIDPASGELLREITEYADLRVSAILQTETAKNAELETVRSDRTRLLQSAKGREQAYDKLATAHAKDGEELAFLRVEHDKKEQCLRVEHEKTERLLRELLDAQKLQAATEQSLRDSRDKSDSVFFELDETFRKLQQYSASVPGRFSAVVVKLYKCVRLRPRLNTAFDDVLEKAAAHRQAYPDAAEKSVSSKLGLMIGVVRYLLAHPVSSLRSFSWLRLRRALGVFLSSDRQTLSLWVGQRFPATAASPSQLLLPELGAELDSMRLDFPQSHRPKLSIVIPVYNEYRTTVFCLQSLLRHQPAIDYEVLVADDASSDLTTTIGERISGLIVCRAETNRGFVRNCNATAELARGEYLLLLNNDTAVTGNGLQPLIDILDERAAVGIVGPRLLFGNGELQEAGGIVWDDGSGWNFGRMDAADKPEYNYVRSTDYVSGACLMIRRALWQEIGGFDERYAPAYYEDTDLCFAAREKGFDVVYQPASQIVHYEGVSNGTEPNSGIKQYQVENQSKFMEKWRDELQRCHYPNAQTLFSARDRSRDKRTVLVVDHYVPSFDKDAGSRSTWLYLQLMLEMGYNVKFIGANFFPHKPYTEILQQAGVEVLVGEYMARNLDKWLQQNAQYIDVVYLHRPHVAEQFLPSLLKMAPRPRLVYFGHDLHYLRTEREAGLSDERSLLEEARVWREREFKVFDQVDTIYYPSQVEIDELHKVVPDLPARAIPLYVLDDFAAPRYRADERSDALFVAGFNHPPNQDGLKWFIDAVMPLLGDACPQLRLHVVGSNMPPDIRVLASQQVVIHGYLNDEELAELYAQVKLAVVPLRYGAGIKGKVIEALQQGLPLVTTSIGAEGMPLAESVMGVADDAKEFADEVIRVCQADAGALSRLAAIPEYLQGNFSKARARAILQEDFGHPRRSA